MRYFFERISEKRLDKTGYLCGRFADFSQQSGPCSEKQRTAENTTRYEGMRLLAADGSDFLLAANPDDLDSFFPGTEEQKAYNLLHLNALYDLVQHIYMDGVLQKRRKTDECGALVSMVDRSRLNRVLLLADRGYESFNVLAHIQEKGWNFLVRIKDGVGGIACGLDLPNSMK